MRPRANRWMNMRAWPLKARTPCRSLVRSSSFAARATRHARRGRCCERRLFTAGEGAILALRSSRLGHCCAWCRRVSRVRGGGPLGSMVHAEDVASAALHVLERPEAHGQVYNVADDDPMPLGERIAATFRAYGLRTVPVPVLPGALLEGIVDSLSGQLSAGLDVATLAAWRAVIARHDLKHALRPRFDAEIIADLRRDRVVDTRALCALGWRARYPPLRSGVSRSAALVPGRTLGAALLGGHVFGGHVLRRYVFSSSRMVSAIRRWARGSKSSPLCPTSLRVWTSAPSLWALSRAE